jgi:hypothetical protein
LGQAVQRMPRGAGRLLSAGAIVERTMRIVGVCGALWGVAGVLALLGFAVLRLMGRVIDMFGYDLRWYHWLTLLLVVFFMAYTEGYRGFQRAFSPRVAARAKYVYHFPRLLHVLAAPVFCMGYFHIHRRRQIGIFVLTSLIVLIIGLMRFVDQPWQGIVDAGVVVGLTWGIVSVGVYSVLAFTSTAFCYAPEVPEQIQLSLRHDTCSRSSPAT